MSTRSTLRLLLPLVLCFALTPPVMADHKPGHSPGGGSSGGGSSGGTFPATEFRNWLCEVDLLPFGPAISEYTTDTRKLCTGSSPDGNIHIQCVKQLDTESLDAIPTANLGQTLNVSCQVNRAQCDELCGTAGHSDCVQPVTGTLSVDSGGLATLKCSFNGS